MKKPRKEEADASGRSAGPRGRPDRNAAEHGNTPSDIPAVIATAHDITEGARVVEALRESEARFRAVAANTPDHILMQDRGLRYQLVINPQMGLTEADMLGKTDYDFLDKKDAEKLTAIKRKVLETGEPYSLETSLLNSKGETEFFDGVYVPKSGPDGKTDGLIGYFRNTTERKRLEEALRFLAEPGESASGENFFQSLARYLAKSMGMDFVCIDRLQEGLLAAQTLAVYFDGKFDDNVAYTLKDTPCGDVLAKKVCCFTRDVRRLFPKDEVLQQMLAESYVGTILRSSRGRPIGLIAVIGRQPLTNPELAESLLQMVAARAGSELERQTAEEELHASEERLRLAQESTELEVWDFDPRSGVIQCGRRVKAWWGLSPEQTYTYDTWLARLCSVDKEAAVAEVQRSVDPDGTGRQDIEYRVVQPDGSALWMSVHAQTHFAELDGRRKAVRIIGTMQDITARKRQEEELHRLNRTLKALSDSDKAMMRATEEVSYLQEVCRIIIEDCGHAMVWIGYAENDETKTVRPVACAGFDKGYLETLKITWDDTERGRGPTGTCIRMGEVRVCRNMRTDPAFQPWRGEAIKRGYASSIALPLMPEGRVLGALTIYFKEPDACSEDEVRLLTELASDLAYGIDAIRSRAARARAEKELQKMAEDLERSNKDLEQFAHVTSHDLKEPLRMVTGFTGLLKSYCKGKLDAKAEEYISFASDAATRMQGLIEDLLAYSRAGRERTMASVDIDAIVTAALKNLQFSIEDSGAVITRDALPQVTANAVELTQVFQNLIGNAIKFREPGAKPEIHISARKGAEKVSGVSVQVSGKQNTETSAWLFSVRDNGIGIDPSFNDRIFMIFNRLHTRDEYPGTGVGLAICKKVVERYGGRIWVESGLGQGSTFWFTIPARKEDVISRVSG
jgi:PAS domain S-box-containing protein